LVGRYDPKGGWDGSKFARPQDLLAEADNTDRIELRVALADDFCPSIAQIASHPPAASWLRLFQNRSGRKPQPFRSLRAQATWRDCPSVEAVAGRDLVSSTCPRPAQAVHRDHALPRWLGKNNKGRRLKEDYAMVHSVGCVFALSGACKIETGGPLRQDGQADWPRAARRDRAAGRCARTGRLTGHDTAAMGRGNRRAAAPGRAG